MKFDKDWWTEAAGGPVATMIVKGPAAWCWPSYKTGSSDHIITCFSMSENAELMKEGGNGDAGIIAKALSDLDALFPSQEGGEIATKNYSGDGMVMDWGEEEYVGGAYSYPTVKTFEGNNGYNPFNGNARLPLREPVADGRVSFAGEATSLVMSATVPGAVDEGERAAWKGKASVQVVQHYEMLAFFSFSSPQRRCQCYSVIGAPVPTLNPTSPYPTTYVPTSYPPTSYSTYVPTYTPYPVPAPTTPSPNAPSPPSSCCR